MKKEGPGLFDVAIGSYDGAEVCELVGIFMLSHLPERYDRNIIGGLKSVDLSVEMIISFSVFGARVPSISAVALYTILLVRQCPVSGHRSGLR